MQEERYLRNDYRTLLRACKPIVTELDKKLIRKAFNFALDAHKDTRRKSGELFIFHPLAVAIIVAREIGLGATSIICSLLHDAVEDTAVSLEDIEAIFGKKVAKIIDGLTKISGFIGNTKSIQAENFRKILLTMSEDVRVILIKLADRLHNMRTLDAVKKESQLKIASETLELFAPLAHRLGLYSIKSELEDLSLKYTEPLIYHEIDTKIKLNQSQMNRFVKSFMKPIQQQLDKAGLKYEVLARYKSAYSIYKKMKTRNIDFNQIFDLFAVRIIIENSADEKTDCWRIYSIITDFYKPNPERLRDWLSTPKVNGYESLHTTVMSYSGKWVEVQIRSRRMDDIAEKGYAAHWKYKERDDKGDTNLDEWIKSVGEMLRAQDGTATEFFDEFKMNLFSREVYIFTPQGELKVLPMGATALDFAFDIHTHIGLKCIGAKVNNKLVPLSQVLKTGDQVEIITSNKQKPKPDWLDYVITAKAKSRIKQSLKNERKEKANKGKELISTKLKLINSQDKNLDIDKLIEYFQLPSSFEFYYNVGINRISISDINHAFKLLKIGDTLKSSSNKKTDISERKTEIIILGDGETETDLHLAKCCNPIPGDEIFGYITVGEGILIHRTNCPVGIKLMSNYGYRIIKASWQKKVTKNEEYFPVGIRFRGIDNLGILSSITKIISEQFEVNMRMINASSKDGAFEGSLVVNIYNTEHLDHLIEKIKEVDGIETVTRFHVDESID